tara:strand:+ start:460 stop:663 length:204 start_codon:yes stop_codon:yes gene_type:complete
MDKFYLNGFREFNQINSGRYHITPKSSNLITFPAWVPHYVEENKSDEDRIGLAFNFNIETLGRKGHR